MKSMLLFLLLMPIIAFCQGGVYTSTENIEAVAAPHTLATQTFLYRIGPNVQSLQHYKVTMSNLLYNGKKAFQWPTEIDDSTKYGLAFFSSRDAALKGTLISEIIYNDKLILTTSDSLFYLRGSEPIVLRRIAAPGITLISANSNATYQRQDIAGRTIEKPIPAFYYTLNDTTQICLVRSEGWQSQEIDPYTASGQFRQLEVNLAKFPELRLPTRVLMDIPHKAEIDSAEFLMVDSMIQVLQTWITEDSSQIDSFMRVVNQNISTGIPRAKYESNSIYEVRNAAYQQERTKIIAAIAKWSQLDQALIPMQQKLRIFKAYRNQQADYLANEERKRNLDFRTQLVNHHVWNRLFGSAFLTLGRNMDRSYANPSPTNLAGGGLRVEWASPLYKKTSWIPHFDASYSQWRAQKSVSEYSRQFSGIFGIEAGIPIGIAPAGNYSLDTTKGLVIQLAAGPAIALRKTEQESEVAYGGSLGLNFLWGSMPMLMSIDYSYFSDRFGDLAIRFGIPLFRKERK